MTGILKKAAVATAVSLAFAFNNAQADVTNTRPYDPAPAGTNLGLLQSVFTGIGSSIDVYTDQESAAIFAPSGAGSSSGAFVASVTWGWSGTEVGMYKYGDPTTDVKMFSSPLGGMRVGIRFDLDGSVTTYNPDTLTVIDTQAGFGTQFGFYFKSSSGDPTWYTEDSLNTYGSSSDLVQALIYAGNGDMVTLPAPAVSPLNDIGHYYVAFEGHHNDGTWTFASGNIDFNDIVFQMESVTPVPEPETYAMLLAGLGLMGFVARRRRRALAA